MTLSRLTFLVMWETNTNGFDGNTKGAAVPALLALAHFSLAGVRHETKMKVCHNNGTVQTLTAQGPIVE
jgi:hypothetical protein